MCVLTPTPPGAWACKFSPQKEVWGDYREEWWENLGALSHSLTRQTAFKDRRVYVCAVWCDVCVSAQCELLLPHQKAESSFPLCALYNDCVHTHTKQADTEWWMHEFNSSRVFLNSFYCVFYCESTLCCRSTANRDPMLTSAYASSVGYSETKLSIWKDD